MQWPRINGIRGEAVQVDVTKVEGFGEVLGVGEVAVVLAGLLCKDYSSVG